MNTAIPSPRTLADDLHKVLAVLLLAKNEATPWLSAAEISARLRDRHGVSLHWRTIEALFRTAQGIVSGRKRGGRIEYQIMQAGEELLIPPAANALVIDPSRAVQAISSLHQILSGLAGTILICDPYVDAVTLEHLDACPPGATILLLTENLRDSGKLRRLHAAMGVQGRRLEIHISPPGQLHDRYIIDDHIMFLSGTSLNGFGKRQSFLVSMGPDIRSTMLTDFQKRWATANPWS